MVNDMSVSSLVSTSKCDIKEYYNSDKVKAYSVNVRITLPEYRNIEHNTLTNRTFTIHLDMSRRKGFKALDVIDLTPKRTEASEFTRWLRVNLGDYFVKCYYEALYGNMEQEYGELL